ncbi:hypothetical protein H8356DRAFT_960907 [Neocallimastix lanati (nom. inval.)]|nr:hypothetical protein H8356DRAFT_960907 [Neocallimastix sp. JGI-2020a]
MENISVSSQIEKQRAFITLIKDIQVSLNSKEYKKQGYSFNEYVKMKWNISQAQAYRYLICGKVLDQLEEFEIKPSYERLCKALHDVAKNPIQMKLLWSTILMKSKNKPEFINSNYVAKVWKELCKNEKYSHICNYENDLMAKVESSLNKLSREKNHNQLKYLKYVKPPNKMSCHSLSILPEPMNNINSCNACNYANDINILLSPVSDCSSPSNNTKVSINSFQQFDLMTIPTIQTKPDIKNDNYLPSPDQTEYYYNNPSSLYYIPK